MNTRSSPNTEPDTESPATGSRLRTELIIASLWLAFGLFVVPAAIYWVGASELGPYGDQAGLSTLYGAFFADLASGAPRVWLLVLGPLLLISAIRLLYLGVGSRPRVADDADGDAPPPKPAKPVVEKRRRVEPRVG